MGLVLRDTFASGWQPSADAVHAPADALLRADNCVLDERGVVALRKGSAKINGVAFADLDIHSLFTAHLSGTRYRMSGAGAAVYANGTALSPTMAGSGDTAFGSALGQILFARSTSKHKYDGTTVRNWGIAAPNAAPTVAARAADSKTFVSCNSGEAPAIVIGENDGSVAAFATGYDGTANGAFILPPNASTGRGFVTKTFAAATNFTSYDAGQVGTDEDIVSLWLYVTEPQYLSNLILAIDVNDGSFETDYYQAEWKNGSPTPITLEDAEFLDTDYVSEGDERLDLAAKRERALRRIQQAQVQGNAAAAVAGWNNLQMKRGALTRVGATAGLNWSTVRAVRVMVFGSTGGAAGQIYIDDIKIIGGAQRPLTGKYKWRTQAVRNDGTYTAKSGPSTASSELELSAQGATVTVTNGTVTALDTQVNELWVFRMGGNLDAWYRVAVLDSDPFAGAQTIQDEMSDRDALIANIRLETYNTTPPDTIVGIVSQHYDRLFALTATHLYPSQPRNLDSFDTRHPVRVGDASEVAYWVAKVNEELYVGTSKDIYRFEGNWTLLGDNTLDVSKRGLGVAQPPISSAIAQDGDTVAYLAADGWRQLGADRPFTAGVDLLYRGETRHGVSPVNLSTGRFKAAFAGGWFTAITPEGASTTSSAILHRYVPTTQQWYRHTYTPTWRCVYREPDGTLIASDTAGFVYTLDTGTQDAGSNIPVVLWTPVEDNQQPNQRKDGWEIRVRANSGGATATVALHLDGSGASSTTMACTASDLTPTAASLSAIAAYRQSQLRVTGSFSTFLWYDYTITYRDRPPVLVYAEPKPEVRGTRRKRFAGLSVILDTLNAAATVTPVVDDVDQTGQSVTTNDALSTALTFQSVVGRDLWAKIAKATGFEYYGLEPNVIAELPPPVQGRLPDTNGGYPFRKRLIGLRLRACTLGVSRTFTPIVDGVSLATFAATTHADEPDDIIHYFTSQQVGTDVGLSVDGNIEAYGGIEPIVQQQFPQPVRLRVPDSDGGYSFRKRLIGLRIRACTLGSLRTFTPIIDGTSLATFTATTASEEPDDLLHYFTAQQVGTDVAFSVDGNVELYDWAPIVQQQFPQPVRLRVADTNAGTPRPKLITGLRIRACTIGSQRTFTPILDGVSQAVFDTTTHSTEPDEIVHSFTTPQVATDVAFSVDGNIELYDWAPVVDAVLPLGRTLWDTGPIDLGGRVAWVPELEIKAKLTGTLTITPYIDDIAQTAVSVSAPSGDPITTHTVPLARTIRGRQVRFRVTSASTFYVYWIKPRYRLTGADSDLKTATVENAA